MSVFGLLDSLFAAADDSASPDRSPWSDFWFMPVPYAGGRTMVTEERAIQLAAVYTCIKLLAETIGQVPFGLYRLRDDGYLEPQPKHPLHRLVSRRPNRWQTPFEFKTMLQGHAALRGNGYAAIHFEERSGWPGELVPLHPDRVQPEVLETGVMRYRYTAPSGETVTYAAGEMLHLRGLTSDGYVGINPIAAQRLLLSGAIEIDEYSRRFYANDGQPRGWIEHPTKFKTDDDRRSFVSQWQEAQTGVNRGKAAVLQHGMKYHELKISNEDAQFLETKKYKRAEIFGMFMPSMALDELNQVTYSNSENRVTSIQTFTMAPWFVCWEEAFERALIDEERDADTASLQFGFDENALLRLDSKARAEYFKVAAGPGGWITRNEARLQEGRSPRNDMDKPLEPRKSEPRPREDEPSEDEDRPAAPPSREARPRPPSEGANRMARAAAERVLLRASSLVKAGKAADIDAEPFRGFAANVLGLSIARAAQVAKRIADDANVALGSGVAHSDVNQILLGMIPHVAELALLED